MKTSASLKKARLVLSLLLCCLLVAGSLGLTAAADVDGPPAETAEESQPDTNIDDAAIAGETEPAPDAGLSPDEAAEPPECGNITVTGHPGGILLAGLCGDRLAQGDGRARWGRRAG